MTGRATPTWRFSLASPALAGLGLAVALLMSGTFAAAWSISGVQGAGLALVGTAAVFLASRMARPSDVARSEGSARAILNGVASAVVVIDPDGVIEELNPAAAALFEAAEDELIGKNIATLMPPDTAGQHVAHTRGFQGTRTNMSSTREVVCRTLKERTIPVEVFVSAVEIDGQRRIVGVVNDISKRKARDLELNAAMTELKRANDELDKFAYVASHDLKAPLRVIDNASQWLAEDLEPHLTNDTRESLDMLRGRVRRMERLLDALLEHSRIGRVIPDTEWLPGDRLADEIVSRVEVPDGFTIAFDDGFKGQTLPLAPLDCVLSHLVENAIRHHDSNTGHVDVTLDVSDTGLTFRVSDDGPGIPKRYHEKVFQVFQTLVRRDEFEANGMGLAIVQKHAQVAGGSVEIESNEGRGTTVRLDWPAVARGRAEEAAI